MGKIIWIASYPKSGNTWMRAFLANYILDRDTPLPINELGQFTLSDTRPRFYQEAAGRPIGEIDENESLRIRGRAQELIAAARPHDHFVKTHNMNTTHQGVRLIEPAVTQGAIYILRNPLDLVMSYAAHFGQSINQAVDALNDPGNSTIDAEHRILTLLGRWSDHVASWRDDEGMARIVVRYEDLVADARAVFTRILETLGMQVNSARLERALTFSAFEELAGQEARTGFTERPPHSERFFRQGRSGAWREELTAPQIDRISADHREIMKDFGYL